MFQPNAFQQLLFEQIFSSTKGKSKITGDLMGVWGVLELHSTEKNRRNPANCG